MELSRLFNGKKFMWDGKTYEDKEAGKEIAKQYKDSGFEVEIIEVEKQWYLFTRRVVKEVVVQS
jgi:chromosome segregation and condensation protein ScpB